MFCGAVLQDSQNIMIFHKGIVQYRIRRQFGVEEEKRRDEDVNRQQQLCPFDGRSKVQFLSKTRWLLVSLIIKRKGKFFRDQNHRKRSTFQWCVAYFHKLMVHIYAKRLQALAVHNSTTGIPNSSVASIVTLCRIWNAQGMRLAVCF